MSTTVTVTIGIPAYNEAKNIGLLLDDLARQKTSAVVIEKIHLISDGSSDDTVAVASQTQTQNLHITAEKKRKGIATRLNQLCQTATSDILVILNADVRLEDMECIEKLCGPIVTHAADLTSCNIVSTIPKNLIQRSLAISMDIKTRVFESYRHGDNIYTCHGTARAFSKRLYTNIRFPHSVGEDAYSYVYAVSHGYTYAYVTNTTVRYHLPSAVRDHTKQSVRYEQSKKQFISEFGELTMRSLYYLPKSMLIHETLQTAIRHPLEIVTYTLLFTASRMCSRLFAKPIPDTWDIAKSSK